MDNIKLSVMQYIVKLLSPSSFAYGNIYAFQKAQNIQQLKRKLQIGDVILSRTNNNIYEMSRKYMGINYDHVAVVINSNQVIHISPPIISKINVQYFINSNRQPFIIRPKIQDMQKYLTVLQNFLGQKYNTQAIFSVVFKQFMDKLQRTNQNHFSFSNLKSSRICSDAVLYAICKGSPSTKDYLQNIYDKTRFSKLGYFLPDQIADILLQNKGQIILKSSLKSEYKMVQTLQKGGQKLIEFTKNMITITEKGYNKTNKLIKDVKNKFQYNKILDKETKANNSYNAHDDSLNKQINSKLSKENKFRMIQILILYLIRDKLNPKVELALLLYNAVFIISQLSLFLKYAQTKLPKL